MKRSRLGSGVVVLLLVALVASACGSSRSNGSAGVTQSTSPGAATSVKLDNSHPVKILFVGGFTGPTSKSVNDAKVAMEASIDDVEEHGGIDGRTVKLETLDTTGDPTQAVSVLQRYVTQNAKPDFVVPAISSTEALAMVPLLTREKIVSMNNAANPALNSPNKYPYHFGYSLTSKDLQAALPGRLKEMNVKKLAVITPKDAYGTSIADGLKETLAGTGVELTVEEFNPADLDISVSYQRAISGHPDAVFFEAIGDITQRLVETRLSVGATNIPTIAGFGISSIGGGPADWADPAALKNLTMEVFRFQKYVPPEQYTDVQKRFFAHMAAHGGLTSNVLTPGLFWDVIQVLAKAANDAGSTDGDAVKKVLESATFKFPELMMYSHHGYSADDHFPKPTLDDLSFTTPGPMVKGMFQTTGG